MVILSKEQEIVELTPTQIIPENTQPCRGTVRVNGDRPKLLDLLRQALRTRHYSRSTEQTYCHWVKRYVHFHNLRHPAEMAEPEINAFMTQLAVKEKVSA
ncbi:MAG TPA: phage integrase N-terminal SAM-like domain-containing protein, partial [bacterium]|nr:phage integrase N-terminal SAM-like domain-containing protein [bacterium]